MHIDPQEALAYHSAKPAGKIAIVPTKPCLTPRDPSLVYKYTGKGNLVAVVTNGTAVLGLGNIGPAAGKPVMEGKAVLFKRFADIDVFDIELATTNPNEIVRACQMLEPTFGGINLEDIKAPECFYIEEECRRTMKIPVFHDDQHGTAIISGAALTFHWSRLPCFCPAPGATSRTPSYPRPHPTHRNTSQNTAARP